MHEIQSKSFYRPTRDRGPLRALRLRALQLAVLGLSLSWLGCAGGSIGTLPSFSSTFLASLGTPSFDVNRSISELEAGDLASLAPSGPGSVFATPAAAAVDALAYSYLKTRQAVSSERRARGGAIFPVPGGFSYEEPAEAWDGSFGRLRYRLRPTDVAHFQHDPHSRLAWRHGAPAPLSRSSRRFVDRRDPLSRPLFFLTTRRYVRVYSGAEGEQTLARVERVARRGATDLELRRSATLVAMMPGAGMASQDQPLALQPARQTIEP